MKDTKDKSKKVAFEKIIDVRNFNELEPEVFNYEVKKILNNFYSYNEEIPNDDIEKVSKLIKDAKDAIVYLNSLLVVELVGTDLKLTVKNNSSKKIPILLFIIILLFALILATYNGLVWRDNDSLNLDIDGDGVADLNIDTNNDKIAELNIDTNNDKIPDLAIDYKGNNKPIFSLDKDDDGKADFNLVTDDTKKPSTCKVNCDSDGDGWPDYNFDLDGDGIPDFDIVDDETREIVLNMDLNGDGICDVMCDDDKDGKCDRNCSIPSEDKNDPSSESGNSGTNGSTADLVIEFKDGEELDISGLMPEGQVPGLENPTKKFSVTNTTDYALEYSLGWEITENTFITDNFQYKVASTNGGYNNDYLVIPKVDTLIKDVIVINPHETHEYVVTYRLRNTSVSQDEDQRRIFKGHITVK